MRKAVLALDPTFVDTFEDGIDSTRWVVQGQKYDSYTSYDVGVIRAAQVDTEGGELRLHMTKRKEPRTFKGDPTTERWWDTSEVRLNPAFGFAHGAYEVEAAVPAAENVSAGVWPAIWSRPTRKGIPGEIDVMEAFGHGGTDAKPGASLAEGFTATLHYTQDGSIKHRSRVVPDPLRPLSREFHKYGVYKGKDEVIIYFDREEVLHVKREDDPAAFDAAFPAGEPFDIRFTIQAGGKWGGWPNEGTAENSTMSIRKVTFWDFDQRHSEEEVNS